MDKNDITQKIYDKQKIVDIYSKTHNDINTIKIHADNFIAHLNGLNIIDIGCGPGRDVKYFFDNGYNVVGLDMSEKLLQVAKKKTPGASFEHKNMKNLDVLKKKFNGLWSCGSFYHLEKKDAILTLKGFYNILLPGGQMYLALKEGEGEIFIKNLGEEKFYSFYNEDEIVELVEKVGFNIREIIKEKKEANWINIFAEKK